MKHLSAILQAVSIFLGACLIAVAGMALYAMLNEHLEGRMAITYMDLLTDAIMWTAVVCYGALGAAGLFFGAWLEQHKPDARHELRDMLLCVVLTIAFPFVILFLLYTLPTYLRDAIMQVSSNHS